MIRHVIRVPLSPDDTYIHHIYLLSYNVVSLFVTLTPVCNGHDFMLSNSALPLTIQAVLPVVTGFPRRRNLLKGSLKSFEIWCNIHTTSGIVLSYRCCPSTTVCPGMASCGKAGSCFPLVGSLQYRTITNCMYCMVSSALLTTHRDMTCTVLKAT